MLKRCVVEYVVRSRQLETNEVYTQVLLLWEEAQRRGIKFDVVPQIQKLAEAQEEAKAQDPESGAADDGVVVSKDEVATSEILNSVNTVMPQAELHDTHDPSGPMISSNTHADSDGSSYHHRTFMNVKNLYDRVIQLDLTDMIDFDSPRFAWLVDPAPYQVSKDTPLAKVYQMLTMLRIDRVYVIDDGTLAGEISVQHLLNCKL